MVPFLRAVLLPVQYLNTHLHELSHAFVALATGGEVERILVFANGSGVTPVRGGNIVFTASAGYLGATLLGMALIAFSKTPASAQRSMRFLAVLMAIAMILWVRGDIVGLITGFVWVGLLAWQPLLKGQGYVYAAQFLGIQQCLASLGSVLGLVQLSAATEVHSDAMILQQSTGIPAVAWAVLWTVVSLVALGFTARASWRHRPVPIRA